jgi:GTP-binding protein HflX
LVGVEFTSRRRSKAQAPGVDAGAAVEESLAELAALADTAGAAVVDQVIQARPGPEAATLIGSGKVEELAGLVAGLPVDVVIFDHDLTPTQQRNLESALGCKILDRTQLILDIFARRARTREGQLQVELAQLNYLLPRLTGHGIEMSRLGGGIGTRGPGETQLETDRRRIFRRIRGIKEALERVRGHREVQRKQRQAVPLATVALVGYTNAGKSTLFNRLTGAEVLADARLFATLDPTIRALTLPAGRRVLLSDTVGFIRNLPTLLIQAFRATLEEVTEAALLLHVVDASSANAPQHVAQVEKVLAELGSERTPQLLVLNKADLVEGGSLDAEALHNRISGAPGRAVAVSAKSGLGVDGLVEAIAEALPAEAFLRVRFRFPAGEGFGLHLLHELGRVSETRYEGEYCLVEADVSEPLKRRLSEYVVD